MAKRSYSKGKGKSGFVADPAIGEAKREALKDKLGLAIQRLQKSGTYAEYMRFWATHYAYSFGNIGLILYQKPTATHVRNFQTWIKLGRAPRKNEGLSILVPHFGKGKAGAADADVEKLRGFGVGTVWDIENTDPIPGKEQPVTTIWNGGTLPLLGATDNERAETVYQALKSYIQTQGYKWTERHEEGKRAGDTGYYLPTERRVNVNPNRDNVPTRLQVAIHESTHALDHDNAKTRSYAAGECIAESVGFLVMSHFGFIDPDSDDLPPSIGYIAGWAQGTDGLELVKALGREIGGYEKKIIEGIEAYLPAQAKAKATTAAAAAAAAEVVEVMAEVAA